MNDSPNGYASSASAFATPATRAENLERLRVLNQIVANATLMPRQAFQRLMDPRRNLEEECGYPEAEEQIGIDLLRRLYDRHPLANRVVEVWPKECWQSSPTVYEKEDGATPTDFEDAWDELGKQLQSGQSWFGQEKGSSIWEILLRADVLSGIGHFGIILLGIDDGRNLQDPADGVAVLVGNKVLLDTPITNAEQEQIKRDLESGIAPTSVPTANTARTGYVENANPEGHNQYSGAASSAEDAHSKVRELLDDINSGGVSSARIEALGEHVRAMPRGEVDKLAGKLGIAGKLSSKKDAVDKITTALKNQYGMWVKKQAFNREQEELAGNREPGEKIVRIEHPTKGTKIVKDHMMPLSKDNLTANLRSPQPFKPLMTKVGTGGQPVPESQSPGGYLPTDGMGPSLMGTDAQYFGVQFGPSEQPAEQPAKAERKLLFMQPFDESLVQIVRYEWNIRNPRFGQPVMYRVTLNDPREQHSGVGLPLATVYVHWSRVIHLADNLENSKIFGRPRMRPCLHPLLDSRKIYGAGAEGYWKSCFAAIALSTHPQLGGDVDIDDAKLDEMVENFQNGLTRFLKLVGMQATQLAPSVVDPSTQIEVNIEAICIQIGIPVRVFKGSERGELASAQDDEKWNDRVRGRQNNYCTPKIIVPLVDRLIQLGVLPEPGNDGYNVEWPDLDSLGNKDKAGIFLSNTQALAAYAGPGNCEAVMPPHEWLTLWGGMEEDEVEALLEASAKAQEDDETMTIPPAGALGNPTTPQPPPPVIAGKPGQPSGTPPAAGGGAAKGAGPAAPAKPAAPLGVS